MGKDDSHLAKWDCKVVHSDPRIGEGITPRFSRDLIKQRSNRKIPMFSYPPSLSFHCILNLGRNLHLVKASAVKLIE